MEEVYYFVNKNKKQRKERQEKQKPKSSLYIIFCLTKERQERGKRGFLQNVTFPGSFEIWLPKCLICTKKKKNC